MKLGEIGEDRLLNQLSLGKAAFACAGDDCAVVEIPGSKKNLVLKTDCVVERVHFVHEIASETFQRNTKLAVLLTALRAILTSEIRAAVEAARRACVRAHSNHQSIPNGSPGGGRNAGVGLGSSWRSSHLVKSAAIAVQ